MADEYIKYDEGRTKPVDKMASWYDKNARDNGEEVSKPSVVETLKRQYDAGRELNGMQLMMVGQYERDLKRQEINAKKLRESEGHHHNE